MTTDQYWATVSAAFVGVGALVGVIALALWGATLVQNKLIERRAARDEAQARDEHNAGVLASEAPPASFEDRSERVDEGRLRVAVRRSASRHELFEPSPSQTAARLRQEQLDAAAVRRGEETHPIATVRQEMARKVVIEPPMVEGMTLFSYLKHAAPQPSGLAWDSEDMGPLAHVTETMYVGIEGDETLKPVFAQARMSRTELRRHFVRVLVDLTNKGLDEEAIERLAEQHRHLRIAPEQFDAVIGYFVQSLKTYLPPRVFEVVLAQLGRPGGAVGVLRERFVVPA